jgi:hypothetical protein
MGSAELWLQGANQFMALTDEVTFPENASALGMFRFCSRSFSSLSIREFIPTLNQLHQEHGSQFSI